MGTLIVGANGFLGRHLGRLLRAEGVRWDGVIHERREHVPADVRVARADHLDSLPDDYEHVFLVAAHVPHRAMDEATEALLESNVRLVDRVHRRWPRARLTFTSSVAVYGRTHTDTVDEQSSLEHPAAYGLSKLAGELFTRAHPSFAIVRLSSLCGPGMDASTFLPRLVAQSHTGVVTLFGDGSRAQDYLHVEDAARLCWLASRHDSNGVFLGASGRSVSNRALAEALRELRPGVTIRNHGDDPSPSFHYNPRRSHQALGFELRKGPLDALVELLEESHV